MSIASNRIIFSINSNIKTFLLESTWNKINCDKISWFYWYILYIWYIIYILIYIDWYLLCMISYDRSDMYDNIKDLVTNFYTEKKFYTCYQGSKLAVGYFAAINFVLSTMTLNAIIDLTPVFLSLGTIGTCLLLFLTPACNLESRLWL